MALLLLPYPAALSLPTTISPFYCKAAAAPRNPLAAARFPDPFAKGKPLRSTHTARGKPGRGAPGCGSGPCGRRTRPAPGRGGLERGGDAGASRGAAIPPRPQGQGLRAPAAGRRSDGSCPGPAVASLPGRGAVAPDRGRRSPGPASAWARAAAGAGSAESATYFPPAAGAPARAASPATAEGAGGGGPSRIPAQGRRARP